MATSSDLRKNLNQHKPKNTLSKNDDKAIKIAMDKTIEYLRNRFEKELLNYELRLEKSIPFKYMINSIRSFGLRKEFDEKFLDRTIKPDGGVIILEKTNEYNYKKVILISEVKRQGTNDQRLKEGKSKQAQGNAIERLGKNLTGIKAMFNHENITPFVCFGWGCDFSEKLQ